MDLKEAETTQKQYEALIGKLYLRAKDLLLVMVKNIVIKQEAGQYEVFFTLRDAAANLFEEKAATFFEAYRKLS